MTEAETGLSVADVTPDEPRLITRRRVLIGGGIVAGSAAVAAGIQWSQRDSVAEALVSSYVDGDLPAEDPLSEDWARVAPFEVPLLAQQMVAPFAAGLEVPLLRVRSLNNGSQIAFLLEWADTGSDTIDAVHRFRDAVAVQMPVNLGAAPAVTMGQPDGHVHILQWRASWQVDVDSGRQSVQDAYPNMYSDVTPESVLGQAESEVFYPGIAVDNPMSDRERASPVEELVAQGFGTLTHLDEQRAVGNGQFADGAWKVALGFPMSGDAQRVTLNPGDQHVAAFAVWNGGAANRGSRKQWANWTPLSVGGA